MTDDANLSEQSQQRIAKLEAAKARGVVAYPNGFRAEATTGDVQAQWGAVQEIATEQSYALAGRVLGHRSFGKSTFAHIQDRAGRLQIFADLKTLGEESYKAFKEIDLGDIVGITGTPFRTKTGELTLKLASWTPLVKCLHPLPEKWHGLTDVDARYRQRYLDLMTNPEVREVFKKRSRIVQLIREFFVARDYLEVETPMMHPLIGGAAAKPFKTHHNTLHMDLFLRIAPELYLKRLVVGGFDRVFEINRNFRNEGISTQHNPEFTMIEFYQAYATFEDLMDLIEELVSDCAQQVCGATTVTYQGKEVSLAKPWKRQRLDESVRDTLSLSDAEWRDRDHLLGICKRMELEPEADWSRERCLVALFEEKVEPTLIQPTFITHFPTEVSPLSRRNDADPSVSDRFELYITGREIANAFSELNDPFDQRARFEEQMRLKAKGAEETMDYDADYIHALEYGLPPTAGAGIGIDRLVMLLTDSPSIRDVILFPQMRPKAE